MTKFGQKLVDQWSSIDNVNTTNPVYITTNITLSKLLYINGIGTSCTSNGYSLLNPNNIVFARYHPSSTTVFGSWITVLIIGY